MAYGEVPTRHAAPHAVQEVSCEAHVHPPAKACAAEDQAIPIMLLLQLAKRSSSAWGECAYYRGKCLLMLTDPESCSGLYSGPAHSRTHQQGALVSMFNAAPQLPRNHVRHIAQDGIITCAPFARLSCAYTSAARVTVSITFLKTPALRPI